MNEDVKKMNTAKVETVGIAEAKMPDTEKSSVIKNKHEEAKKDKEYAEKEDILQSLLYRGYYEEPVKLSKDIEFTLRTLTTAEMSYADEKVQALMDRGIGNMAATRYMKLYYLAMSILNPFLDVNSNNAKDIVEYIHSEDFGKKLERTVNLLSIKPDVIIEHLYNKYSDITVKSIRSLEPPAGMTEEEHLKN